MCPTHILVHRTPPQEGSSLCLVRGWDTIVFRGGVNTPLRGGYINQWSLEEVAALGRQHERVKINCKTDRLEVFRVPAHQC